MKYLPAQRTAAAARVRTLDDQHSFEGLLPASQVASSTAET